jgi:surfeit locus 1 family protein
LFCALGTWQLYRLQWKTALISEITFGLDSTPVKYSNTIKKNYQRVVSEGKFNFEEQIYLYSLNESGKPGYDVITPYKTLKNENVLVNRGWINKNLKGNLEINLKENEVKITGLLREIYKANIFKPKNDLKNNIWFTLDANDLKELTGKQFPNYMIFLEKPKNKVPAPKKVSIDVPNNHLKYAITWYSIAISILFYYLYFRRKK